MAEQNEYLVAGKRKDTGEMLSTTVLAGDDSEAVSVAENLGIDVERVEYVRTTSAAHRQINKMLTPAPLLGYAVMFVALSAFVLLACASFRVDSLLILGAVISGLLPLLSGQKLNNDNWL